MTRADKYLIAGFLILSAISSVLLYIRPWAPLGRAFADQAVVTSQGKIVRKMEFSDSRAGETYSLPGRLGPVTVELQGRRIRMLDAPCPGKLCVKQGWIEHAGQSIVCIPSEIMIHISGVAPVDAVTR